MRKADMDTIMFFDPHPDVLPLFQAFAAILTYYNRHVFACISFARVKRKAELPEGYMVITLGLPTPLNSERVAVKTEPYPGRWTHHIVVSRPEELDEELLSWIKDAYVFADAKGRNARTQRMTPVPSGSAARK